MIETDPAVAQAVTASRERTLRLLARVARQQGEGYELPSFMIARELYGSAVINTVTWADTYGGRRFNGHEQSLANYTGRGHDHPLNHGRPYTAPVARATLEAETTVARGLVSRETEPTPPAPTATDTRGGALHGCTCADCIQARARFDQEQAVPPVVRTCECEACEDEECQGECSECDNHGCAQCHGEGYSCDDHDCDYCFPDHSVRSCCGYCSECESHPNGVDHDGDVCPNCEYCSDCQHSCGDVG
jgi:hypothetical protein